MVKRLVAFDGKQAMVAGLTWVPLVETKRKTREIRARAMESEASSISIRKGATTNFVAVGYYTPNDEDLFDQSGKPLKTKAVHSFASVAANMVGDSSALVVYAMPDGQHAALAVIDAGVPSDDQVRPIEQIQAVVFQYTSGAVNGIQYPMWTNDLGHFDGGSVFGDGDLWASANASSALASVPVDLVKLGLLAGFVIMAAGAFFAYQSYESKRLMQERIRKQAELDNTPAYMAQVAIQSGAVGWRSEQVGRVIARMNSWPTVLRGWALSSVRCVAKSQECILRWERRGGFSDALVDHQNMELLAESTPDTALLRMNLAKMGVAAGLSPLGARSQLPERATYQREALSLSQVFANAGVAFSTQGAQFVAWPSGGSMTGIPDSVTIKRQDFSVNAPVLLGQELIQALPGNFYIDEFDLVIDATAARAADGYKINLKGSVYVQ